jgi:NADP-dependent 3-hydroxy acid dehydrogenase YdfG
LTSLFANAGIAKFSPIEETLEEDFDDVMRTNVTAVFLTVQAALALVGAGASIVLNGSMAATLGSGESSAYAASKAGVRAMCRSLAGELSPRYQGQRRRSRRYRNADLGPNGRTTRSRCSTRASPSRDDSAQSRR